MPRPRLMQGYAGYVSARKTNWTWRGGGPVSTIYGHIGKVGGVARRSNAWTLESHLECVAKTWRDFQNTWKSECVKNVKVLGWPGFTIQEHFFQCRWIFCFIVLSQHQPRARLCWIRQRQKCPSPQKGWEHCQLRSEWEVASCSRDGSHIESFHAGRFCFPTFIC